jgi:hypothetical protein
VKKKRPPRRFAPLVCSEADYLIGSIVQAANLGMPRFFDFLPKITCGIALPGGMI